VTERKPRLELTWIGKDTRPKLEPRILLEDSARSYHAAHRVTDHDLFDNKLIFGDNLLALKALEQEYTGKITCVFIDPPYNTGSAFTHFDDGLEHSIWLSLMRDRLVVIQRLLSQDGSLWITIDDNEAHYLKVLCDEIFGRSNFVSSIAWMKRVSPANDAKYFSSDHDYILVYAKEKAIWKLNRLSRSEQQNSYYKNPDDDARGPWNSVTYTGNKTRAERPNLYYRIRNPKTGKEVFPPDTLTWRFGPETHAQNEAKDLLYWGRNGTSTVPRFKMFLADAEPIVPRSVWLSSEAGSTQTSMMEQKALFAEPFSTPKPELLLQRIIHIASSANDLILDSFAGSGTTGAVAHKMGRRWIMVEMGEHCQSHIVPRLNKVIDGQDLGGITSATGWKGGGGYRSYFIAPSLLQKDRWGNWIINKSYNAPMLAEALCKLEGFRFAPSDTLYWQHGYSTERDFIYVTTANLSQVQLQQLSDEVGQERTLLVLCTAFRGRLDHPNLTVRKIPKQVLLRCEWGRDDYSLHVETLPQSTQMPSIPAGQPQLFDAEVHN
jgi:adenine-specific DNA-methyltransferase